MLQRTITGAVFVAVLIGSILLGPWSFSILFFIIAMLGLWEFYVLAEKTNHHPKKFAGLMLGVLLFSASAIKFSSTYNYLKVIPLALLLPTLFTIFIIELYRKKGNPFGNIAFTLLGVIYIALPFSLLIPVTFEGGFYSPCKILGIFFILWSSDTGAYLAGTAYGKHKLFERISPGKTWEGTIGGGILALIIAYIVSLYFTDWRMIDWMIIAVLIVVIGSLGDLVKSLFKRSINIKDSGTILPGHGGILDRFDSLIMSVPFIFTYIFFISKLL